MTGWIIPLPMKNPTTNAIIRSIQAVLSILLNMSLGEGGIPGCTGGGG